MKCNHNRNGTYKGIQYGPDGGPKLDLYDCKDCGTTYSFPYRDNSPEWITTGLYLFFTAIFVMAIAIIWIEVPTLIN